MTVGPHPQPWPEEAHFDPELLEHGDARNVVDKYRYWRHEAIVADLDLHRRPFHVAIENWQHDFNIGTVVRTANAFLASAVHVVGNKRWNRRGAMVTDRYQHIFHHESPKELTAYAHANGLEILGVDLLPGSVDIRTVEFPSNVLFVFGQEGPGLSDQMRSAVTKIAHIPQVGSTRSINAGVASGIAMYEWVRRFG